MMDHNTAASRPRRPKRSALGRLRLSKALCRPRLFRLWERLGVHVTPVHFYQPIPDTRQIPDTLWGEPALPPGLRIDEEQQERTLRGLVAGRMEELQALPRRPDEAANGYYLENGRYESVDAELLYLFVRSGKPRRIIEVGSGFSTLVALRAIEANRRDDASYSCELTSIDPYPAPILDRAPRGAILAVRKRVQEVPLPTFAALEAGDILFIDSTHVCAVGSDVQYELLEVVPRVAPGVLVHFHDIFLPAEYPRVWVKEHHRFWNEQYVLQAFLSFNDSFRVLWAGHWMHLRRPQLLQECIPSYDQRTVCPGSLWIERLG